MTVSFMMANWFTVLVVNDASTFPPPLSLCEPHRISVITPSHPASGAERSLHMCSHKQQEEEVRPHCKQVSGQLSSSDR